MSNGTENRHGTQQRSSDEVRTALARLVAELATSPEKLKQFQDDPQAVMTAAELSDEEKDVLQHGKFDAISEFFFDSPRGDITTIEVGSGVGGGGGG